MSSSEAKTCLAASLKKAKKLIQAWDSSGQSSSDRPQLREDLQRIWFLSSGNFSFPKIDFFRWSAQTRTRAVHQLTSTPTPKTEKPKTESKQSINKCQFSFFSTEAQKCLRTWSGGSLSAPPRPREPSGLTTRWLNYRSRSCLLSLMSIFTFQISVSFRIVEKRRKSHVRFVFLKI